MVTNIHHRSQRTKFLREYRKYTLRGVILAAARSVRPRVSVQR